MKNELVVRNSAMKGELKVIEDKMLHLMSESAGNPLEDLSLVNALAEAKKASIDIKQKVYTSRYFA